MEAASTTNPVKILRWLPYWAVFQADIRQTLQSWVYRAWVLVCVLSALGYTFYRVGVYREAGIVQHASHLISDLLQVSVVGSLTLVVILTAGCISSERGTVADSVLSRGISRYQYFLGKWHARLAAVLGTFAILGLFSLVGAFFLLNEDLTFAGSMAAMLTIAALLIMVVSCGVAVSALSNNTLVAIALLWIGLYGVGFLGSLLPASYAMPYRVLQSLPTMLRGEYNFISVARLLGWSALFSCVCAGVSMVYFSRRDV